MYKVERVVPIANHLAESPVWDMSDQALFWVDIDMNSLCRYNPDSGKVTIYQVDVSVGSLGLRVVGGFVLATARGFAFWDSTTHIFQPIADPEPGKSDARFNDGKADSRGRFWAGTMAPGATSSLYRLDPDLSLHTMDSGITVSNGLGWSPDDRVMYFGDSRRRVIYAYDFDAATGEIANRRDWVRLPDDEPGVPDGLAVDNQGFVWSCRWDGWKICRYDPDGKLEREIRMPVQRPSSCAFGGPGFDELFVTTAGSRTDSQGLRVPQPGEGDIYRIRVGVRGLPVPRFAG